MIYANAIEMISERPLLGWHPITAFRELGRRIGYPGPGRDVHNLFLDLLIGVGLLGAIPFMVGLGLCTRAAWKARAGPFGMLPFALIMSSLAFSMTHTSLTWKAQWLALAIACAAASSLVGFGRPLRVPLMVRR